MPELPEVEMFRRYAASTSLHKRIVEVKVKRASILWKVTEGEVRDALLGRTFTSAERHGKHLLLATDDENCLTMHFGMTGGLQYFKIKDKEPRHDRFLLTFSNGYHLAFDDPRVLGRVGLSRATEEYIRQRDLGPDALSISLGDFLEAVRGRRGTVKGILMDQSIIAGIGNIYSDEILFQSRIHPGSRMEKLGRKEKENLYHQMRMVLLTAVEKKTDLGGLSDSFLIPHRRKGDLCPHSRHKVVSAKIAGRTSYFCPQVQKLHK